MDGIKIFEKAELAWNGRTVKATDEEIIQILGPMFALFSSGKVTSEMVGAYVMMLRDVAPERLAAAVLKSMNTCKFLPTIADIREHLEARAPGPCHDVDPRTLPDVPANMYHLDPEEDKRRRMERLHQTKGWDRYYA